MAGRFYITTPIYYVNDRPHIGHVYSTTVADILARYHRLIGDEVFFLTGTDEHGKKVGDAAHANGVSPQEFVDKISGEFQETFVRFRITNNDFIRTTQARHEERVQRYVQHLLDRGDVYLGEYEGWYDPGQEEYVTETNAREKGYKSPVTGALLVRVKEKNYFFRLSKYGDLLRQHIEANAVFIQPEARCNEVLARIEHGLNDVAISRTTEPWGVPMLGDSEHSIYVWIDALFNYRTAVDTNDRRHYWPPDVHLIGKEILWFHAVIWPAVLMALDLPLPGQVYAHSFWISEGQKMSKSLGNFIDLPKLDEYVAGFGLDALRYYLATQGPLGAADADFSHAKFVDVYNADLANTLGNCVSRITKMVGRYLDGALPENVQAPVEIRDWLGPVVATAKTATGEIPDHHSYRNYLKVLDLGGLCENALSIVRAVDRCIDQSAPFRLAKDKANLPQVGVILYHCTEAIRIASLLLWPVLTTKIEKLWRQIGCPQYGAALADRGRGRLDEWAQWGGLKPGTPIETGQALFPRHTPDSQP